MCKKQALGTVHSGYYVCYYLHYNTDGKYIQCIIECGVKTVSITTLNYSLRFGVGPPYSLIHRIICCFDFCPKT
jgi:hypothetical protein